ncbi:MAG: hypothetical protein K8F34_13505 [Candidatus Kuenenia stuttgartiensis]|uniref:Carboxypeptidase C (Cathepsin A) n=2 Tax=Kuenenia stuttgartiensis TaxID=174633 RepID=Q1Q414_KUEST|nr:peptidase S10 [Candidatus Kuenenia stuttgartiensis]MBZ0192688.1 hypothetical protein [Candidatus Kuenenia stuttgartiensis]CAJ74759.1 conserved hypothetical protein [Candidatus Kuenenia stuttgartiensis]
MFNTLGSTNRFTISAFTLICVCFMYTSIVLGVPDNKKVEVEKQQAEERVLDASNRAVTQHTLTTADKTLEYFATAASLTITDKEAKPVSRIFYISYTADEQHDYPRPVTFVFNGGPGAASAYLHMGALGPKRVEFSDDGKVLHMPARLLDNSKSWLSFTDLVFVDPVGTGYSREIKDDTENNKGRKLRPSKEKSIGKYAWGVVEDTDSLARFIRTYLTKEERWLSPIFLAGESYGGFRVARLSKLLQSDFGIVPSGLVLISPAIDFGLLWGSERSLWPWVALLPSYTAVAAFHERSDMITYKADNPRVSLGEVERFALSEYLTGLAGGDLLPDWIEQSSNMMGLHADILHRWAGRVPPARFAKALLSDQRRLVSLYDGSIKLVDSDPARQMLAGGDPYLDRLNAPVTAAFNTYVRDHLDFKTELPYLLLNEEVFKSWNWWSGIQGQQGFAEAVADLKQAMCINPHMQVLIIHGVFDLVTPYYATWITIKQMDLDPEISDNIQFKVYHGGHMPYLHRRSLDSMFKDATQFFTSTMRLPEHVDPD